MKLKCIMKEEGFASPLTIGKVYEMIENDGTHYYVISDDGKKYGHYHMRFKVVSNKRNRPKAVK